AGYMCRGLGRWLEVLGRRITLNIPKQAEQALPQGFVLQTAFQVEDRADIDVAQFERPCGADGEDKLRLRNPVDDFVEAVWCLHKNLDRIDSSQILHVLDLEFAEPELHEGIDANDHVQRQFLLKLLARIADAAEPNPGELGDQHAQEKVWKEADDE